MATGKKNYFRHSFNARNDEFIIGLINEFGERGYFMWFALCEMCGELLADGHQFPLKFHQSRLYKELRCTQRTLNLFLTYSEHRSKVLSTYVEPTFNLEIPNLVKFIGKYSEIVPNKRKEKEIKEKENKLNTEIETEAKKILPLVEPEVIQKKPSPLSRLFDHMPEVQAWLNQGSHDTHLIILKKFPVLVLTTEIPDMYLWALRNNIRAENWMLKRLNNIDLKALSKLKKSFSSNPHTSASNPTGNPYKAQIEELERREAANE